MILSPWDFGKVTFMISFSCSLVDERVKLSP